MTRPDGYDALPKRFKDYIRTLESHIDTLIAQVPARAPDDANNYVQIVDKLHEGHHGYLSGTAQLEVRIDGVDYRIARGDVRHGISGIEIMAVSFIHACRMSW